MARTIHTHRGKFYSLDLDEAKHSVLYTMMLEYDQHKRTLERGIDSMIGELDAMRKRLGVEDTRLGTLNYLPGFPGILEAQAKYEMLANLIVMAIDALTQTRNLLPGVEKVDDTAESESASKSS